MGNKKTHFGVLGVTVLVVGLPVLAYFFHTSTRLIATTGSRNGIIAKSSSDPISIPQPCRGYLMSFSSRVKLGNQIRAYLSAKFLAGQLGLKLVHGPEMFKILTPVFQNVQGDLVSNLSCHMNDSVVLKISSTHKAQYHSKNNSFVVPKKLEFNGMSLRVNLNFHDWILASVQDHIQAMVRDFSHQHSVLSSQVQVIGVHARRGDYAKHLRKICQGVLPTEHYYRLAMDLMRKDFGRLKTMFIMVSDEPDWIRKHFSQEFGLYFGQDFGPTFKNRTRPGYDLAIMANANHSIISIGTFGYWGGVLAGGKVIACDGYCENNTH
eukprot:maker-scaffold200_size264178-snap-gene-1.17 protein:Tk07735 transcript:maker-scaffold200_size264178-snap-gene-1.17-mRNA-1 annotation:"galactoside 2-alpha-l-fucosyltransferase 3-like"